MTKKTITTSAKDIEAILLKEGYEYHHMATARGYVRSGCSYKEEYKGKFGKGYIVHVACNEQRISNNFHCIYYYIKK